MPVPSTLPSLPVEEGSRRLALDHLATARAARTRVAGASDPEALHDYRVALRRLRSCLRAYRKQVRSTVTRKSLRQLRRLAQSTNESRDLEVHLGWLAERRDCATDAQRPGITWLIGRLEQARQRAWDDMRARDEQLFPGLHDRLHHQLSEFRTTVRLDDESGRRSTAVVTARRARSAARRLERRLGRIRYVSSEEEIHRARIAAKHLRYLLEPFAGDLSEAGAVIEPLKALQDAFGDVHDGHMFVPELREAREQAAAAGVAGMGPGLQSLVASLHARGHQAFDSAAREWLPPRAGLFFEQVNALSDALARLSTVRSEGAAWRARWRPERVLPPPLAHHRQPVIGRR